MLRRLGALLLVGFAVILVFLAHGVASLPIVSLRLIADGFTSPVALEEPRDGSGRLFVADQVGLIRIVGPDGRIIPTPFLDLRDRLIPLNVGYDERGLLGLALHADYARNGRFYVYYTAPPPAGQAGRGPDHVNRLSELRVSSEDPNRADLRSERVVLEVEHPGMSHNGGQVAFGPDGYLYVGIGDGLSEDDPADVRAAAPVYSYAQDTSSLRGKILRIDVEHGDPYAIPSDNPFAAGRGRPEIYAYGLRNPYRFSFDLAADAVLLAPDVGEALREELNIITPGGNYGWGIKEGTLCFNRDEFDRPLERCPDTGLSGEPLLSPVLEYGHTSHLTRLHELLDRVADRPGVPARVARLAYRWIGPPAGHSIIGGYVYRGDAIPTLRGRYVYADWITSVQAPRGRIFAATRPASAASAWSIDLVATVNDPHAGRPGFVLSFGEDVRGELYVLTKERWGPEGLTGGILKIVPSG